MIYSFIILLLKMEQNPIELVWYDPFLWLYICSFNMTLMEIFASGNLYGLEIHKNSLHTISKQMVNEAIRKGRLNIIIWLHDNNIDLYAPINPAHSILDETKFNQNIMDIAAGNGYLKMVKWFHNNGYQCTFEAMNWSARYGHFEVVKWLCQSYARLTEHKQNLFCGSERSQAKLARTKFLSESSVCENRQEGCTTDAIDWTSFRGDLEIVKYLHQRGKQCTHQAMDFAASQGHLHVLKYLHSIGKTCSSEAMKKATRYQNTRIINYLKEISL